MKSRSVEAGSKAGGSKKRKKSSAKLSLQLVPRDEALRDKLKALGANPNVAVTVKRSKPLSFLFDYIISRRYADCVRTDQRGSLVSLHHSSNLVWSRGVHDAVSIAQLYQGLSSPEVFRLSYWFDPQIVVEPVGGEQPVAPRAYEIFDAKTSVATRTLYDASNNSLFGSGGGGGGGAFDGSFSLFGDSSLHKLFTDGAVQQNHPLVAASPVKQPGPLAAGFAEHAEVSFSGFSLGSPLASLDFSFPAPLAATDGKKNLFKM